MDRAWFRPALFLRVAIALVLAFGGAGVMATEHPAATNHLAGSADPYLLQHAHNPVDWYPWGPAAFAAARKADKPIFLSVGYSTCYWCHVAERTLYNDPKIAALMNRWFINVKVDREQRPDIDSVYMLATQILTGHGGWPNNVFLTPDLKPFYAGSYFPPEDNGLQPGFPRVLEAMHDAWVHRRAEVDKTADKVYEQLQALQQASAKAGGRIQPQVWMHKAVQQADQDYDAVHGGFGGADGTRFPRSPMLQMLIGAADRGVGEDALAMVEKTLDGMAFGGIQDQLAGGFHRYSMTSDWGVPHFEKMLYDNAQLLRLYAEVYARTGSALDREVALRTAHWLEREMRSPEGVFYTAQDAEVDGEEGGSYLWTRAQIEQALGKSQAAEFLKLYQLVPMPVIHGHQPEGRVLRLDAAHAASLQKEGKLVAALAALAPAREKLLKVRDARPQPQRDEKIVTAQNALAIEGFAAAAHWLDRPALLQVALTAAEWEWKHAYDASKQVLTHQFFDGQRGDPGFLDDYAQLGRAYLRLGEISGDARWVQRAQKLADAMLKHFATADGTLRDTWDHSDLPVAPIADGDQNQPSGSSAAVGLLVDLAWIDHDRADGKAAKAALKPLAAQIDAAPSAWGSLLAALDPAALETLGVDQGATPQTDSASRVKLSASRDGRHWSVHLEVADGFHVNANPAGNTDLIPTTLVLPGHPRIEVDYPPAHKLATRFAKTPIPVYSGRVTLRVTLPEGAQADLPRAFVRLQACNDQICLAPALLPVPLPLPQS